MKVLMISTDRKIFENNSVVKNRIIEYGNLVEELHIIIFSGQAFNPENKTMQISNSNVWLYPTNSINRWFYIYDAVRIGRKLIKKLKFKINNSSNNNEILITCQDPFETGIVGWLIARKTGIKLQLQIHTDFLSKSFTRESFLNKIRVQIAKFLLSKADSIRVVSERIKKSLSAISHQLSANVNVLPIFVDTEKIKNTPANFDLHKKYPQFDFIFLVASRLEKEKNISMIIEAFAKVVEAYPKAGLIIVGDGIEKKKLELLVTSKKLLSSIVFEGWQNDLISYYKTADLFVLSSNYEGFGMTLVEATMSGCSVLTTSVGLVGDILTEENCFVCGVEDKNCFILKMFYALNNRGILQGLNTKAQKEVEKKLINTKEEYLEEYKKSWK